MTRYVSSYIAEESYCERKFAIRTDRYKFIMALSGESAVCRYCNVVHGGVEELYDLERDPSENYNIVDEQPDVAREMRGLLKGFVKQLVLGERMYRIRQKFGKI